MPSKEQKLQVALGHLMDHLPYREKDELPDFIKNMPPEGVEWWLDWSFEAINRQKARNALVYRLQQKPGLAQHPVQDMNRMLDQFSPEGIDMWLEDIDEGKYPLAVISKEKPRYAEAPPKPPDVFRNLFREITWVQQYITPALYNMEGMDPMIQNLTSVSYGESLLDEVGIHNGKLYVPQNGTYVPKQTELYCPFDYERVSAGLVLSDFNEDFAVLAFHSQPRISEKLPARTQFSVVTVQDPELLNLQQLRMHFYDVTNHPCPSEESYLVFGDFTTLVDGQLDVEESFVLKHNPDKQLFYRELHK